MPKQRQSQPSRPVKKKSGAKTRAKTGPVPKGHGAGKSSRPAKPARRPAPRMTNETKRPTAKRPGAKGERLLAAVVVGKPSARRRAASAPKSKPVPVAAGPSSHELAVAAFEHGFQALQQRQFSRAATLLSQVINGYPDEKELQERARVYLLICERQKASQGPNPRSLEERINAATVAINRGAFNEGLTLLRKLAADHGENDYVHYMLSVVHTVLGDFPHALEHLKQAVVLNHENRFLASQDADLDALRQDSGFSSALEASTARPKAAKKR
jgi:tetratricopeptide (TPR) repeat protein